MRPGQRGQNSWWGALAGDPAGYPGARQTHGCWGSPAAALDQALRQHPERHALVAPCTIRRCRWAAPGWISTTSRMPTTCSPCWPATAAEDHPVRPRPSREFDEVHHGVRLIASPSTCIQFKPLSTVSALDRSGPGWRYLPAPRWPDGEPGVAPAAGAVRCRPQCHRL